MADSRNWHAESDTCYVHEPDDRYVVRLLERAITPTLTGRQWHVFLFRDGLLRERIATAATERAAQEEMLRWLDEYHLILGPAAPAPTEATDH